MNPTITDYPHLGKFATFTPLQAGAALVNYVSLTTDDRFELTVEIPGAKAVHDGWANERDNDRVTVTLPLDPPVKGTTNRAVRAEAAMAKALLATGDPSQGLRGVTIGSEEAVAAINKVMANRVERFNQKFHEAASRLVQNASDLFDAQQNAQLAVLKARVEAMLAARKAVNDLLVAARVEQHDASKALMLAYFDEIKAPVDKTALEALGAKKPMFFID